MSEWIWLAAQAVFTIFTVELLRRRVFVAVRNLNQPELILDVWGPLTLVIPLLFVVAQMGANVRGVGWLGIGAPPVYAILALGTALCAASASPGNQQQTVFSRRMLFSCSGAALVLLMLGSAHDLTLWMGQCAFATGAILLWLNTPEDSSPRTPLTAAHVRTGLGMTMAIACALGQGVSTLWLAPEHRPISGAMMLAGAAMTLASAAAIAGPATAIRLGAWTATYGILLSLGMMSLARLLPQALRILREGEAEMVNRIAFGFGAYAPESILLLVFVITVMIQHRLAKRVRFTIGLALIVLAALLAAWRLSAM